MSIMMCRFNVTETNSSSAHAWVYSSLERSLAMPNSDSLSLPIAFKPVKGHLHLDYSELDKYDTNCCLPLRKLAYFHDALMKGGGKTLREMYHQLCRQTGAKSLSITYCFKRWDSKTRSQSLEVKQVMKGRIHKDGTFSLTGEIDIDMAASMDVLCFKMGKYSLESSGNWAETLIDAVFDKNLKFQLYHDGERSFAEIALKGDTIGMIGNTLAQYFGMDYEGFLKQLSLISEEESPENLIKRFALNRQTAHLEESFKQRRHSFDVTFEQFCQTVRETVGKSFSAFSYPVR